MIFPPNCVESTQPLMMKRRKYCKLDVQPVEGWKLVMSLRSGLLMESTWALDCLNVLLYDDNAFSYFGLGNMPGLFEAILEHWRSALIAMFGITKDMEPDSESTTKSALAIECESSEVIEERRSSKQKRKWWQVSRAAQDDDDDECDGLNTEEELAMGRPDKADMSDRCQILTSTNYTKKARFGDAEDLVVDERDDDLFVTDEARTWDSSTKGQDVLDSERWRLGGGNTTCHIVPTMEADLGIVPFVRLLKDLGKKSAAVKAEAVEVKEEPLESKGDADVDEEEETKKEETAEDVVERILRLTGIVLRDPDAARKRWRDENLEEECYMRDEPSLHLTTEAQDAVGRRAVCVSTILRNLSFMPGNEFDFGRSAAFLAIAGRLLLLHHWYPTRTARQRNYDRSEEDDGVAESCSSLVGDSEWWWDLLHVIRENVMVILANVAGALELKNYDEVVARPILHGLLEWAVSSSSYAQDPFPYMGTHSPVSPQRLAIETLCKLCVHEANVDLLLTTPPFTRIESLSKLLARRLYRYEDQVLREFSINLLYYMSGADSGMARVIALKGDQTVGLLLGFIEQAEQNAMMVAQQHGVNALRDNPDSMGTSLDMLRRAASTLHNLSRHPDNISLFVKHEQRLLALVMSQILDQGVAAILSSVLFYMGQEQEELQRQHKKMMEERALLYSKREKNTSSSNGDNDADKATSSSGDATADDSADKPKENGDAADSKQEQTDTAHPSETTPASSKESKSATSPSSNPPPSSAPLVASAS